ncbi:MAG TPA: hypothetical protein V6D50_20775 [Chroococcales cyanobacterium]|jgi:hypothetical protein
MQLKTLLLGAILVGVTAIAPSTLAQTQTCPKAEVVAPSNQTRIIRNARFNYRFRIPTNYGTMAQGDNGILVLDPESFKRAQCLVTNRVPTEYPPGVAVYVETVTPGNRSVSDLVKQKPEAKITGTATVANQSAVVYTSNTLGYQKNVSFFTPDRKSMITISEPYQYSGGKWVPSTVFQSVSNTVRASFTFARR